MIRAGVVLPTFRDTPDDALAAADSAVAAGIDGLFCYDHIWPMGQPERPALAPFPLLGALAARFGPRPDGSGPTSGRSSPASVWCRIPSSPPSTERWRDWRPAASSPAWVPETA